MKRKIIASMMLIILLFTNYVFADSGTAKKINTIAKVISENTVIDRKFSAVTYLTAQEYSNKDYSSILNIEQSNEPTYFSESKKFYIKELDDGNDENSFINRYVAIKMKSTDPVSAINLENNEFITFYYKDAIISGEDKYDTRIIVNGLTVDGIEEDYELLFQVGRYRKKTKEPVRFYPGVGCTETSGRVNIGVAEYFEKDNQRVKVSGIYRVSDLDQKQGINISEVVKDVSMHTQEVREYIRNGGTGPKNFQYIYKNSDILNNIYMNKAENGIATDKIEYIDYGNEKDDKALDIYCSVAENLKTDISDIYFTFENIEAIVKNFDFNKISAFSTFGFTDIRNYYSVNTNVINGTITNSKQDLLKGDNFTVEYAPTNETYYLKRITVDQNNVNLTDNIKNSYTFSNIQADHQIEVEYAEKLTVQFNSKGGTAVTPQLVIPGEKATNPAEPTREGYTFKGWYTDENYTTVYDFNNPVNENKILYAKWEKNDVYHNINYVIIGTPNDNNANNPNKYKEGDTTAITISNPTKEGYTFSGWYETQELSGNKVTTLNVTNRTEDITLYGKWTKNEENANYKVNHYLEDETGTIEKDGKKYKLNKSETKSAKIGSTVTENAQGYVGYNPIKNSLNCVIKEDGTSKLDFYYDKIQYNVTFDSKGGTQVEDQTKLYGEKVTKPSDPTKEGYRFLYWYEEVDGQKVNYDFTSPVTSDKTLIAEWEEVIPVDVYHNITYVILGEPKDNNANNPNKYKEGDTTAITISNPAKQGYTFSGWYETQELSGNKVTTLNVTNRTEDITLYGKWTKNEENANYKVNHYLEDETGTIEKDGKKYKLNKSETKSAKIGSTVTENAQTFEGYEAEKNTLNAILQDDKEIELNFYYNKKQYNVTFDSKGGTKIEDQTKLYGEKVTKPSDPTKEGYRFLYWYEEKDGKKVIYDFDKSVNSDKELIAEWEEIKIIPDNPEKQIPAEKEDASISKKILPNTGIMGTMIGFSLLIVIGLFFGIRYFKLKKYIK